MSRVIVGLLGWMVLAGVATAAPNDLERCIYGSTGIQMDPMVCESLRRVEARDKERRDRQQRILEEARERERVYQDEQAAAQAERARKAEAAYAAEEARRKEALAAQAKEVEAAERAAAAARSRAAAAQAKTVAEKQAVCGDDYGRVAVGMSVSRISQCYGALSKRGELNTAKGVVSTYQSGRTMLHVMDGKVVSWSSY